MNTNENSESTNRRNFLSTLATGAAAISLTTIAPSLNAFAGEVHPIPSRSEDPEEMFRRIKGKHRVVFDATQPHEIMPFAWPKIFLLTNEMTGTPNKDCSVVVVLRHSAIGYAMEDQLWEKYKLGDLFKATDPDTKAERLRSTTCLLFAIHSGNRNRGHLKFPEQEKWKLVLISYKAKASCSVCAKWQ